MATPACEGSPHDTAWVYTSIKGDDSDSGTGDFSITDIRQPDVPKSNPIYLGDFEAKPMESQKEVANSIA